MTDKERETTLRVLSKRNKCVLSPNTVSLGFNLMYILIELDWRTKNRNSAIQKLNSQEIVRYLPEI